MRNLISKAQAWTRRFIRAYKVFKSVLLSPEFELAIQRPEPTVQPVLVTFEKKPNTQVNSYSISSETTQTAQPPTLNEYQAFLDSFIKVQNSSHTRRAYTKDIQSFFRFLQNYDQPLSVHALVEYREHLRTEQSSKTGQPLSHVSINRKMATIKSFLNWLVLNGVIPNNPAKAVKSFRAGRESPTRDIPNDRVKQMLTFPARHKTVGRMHYSILMLLFHLGLRRAELCDLRTSDIFVQENMPVLRVRGKGDRERVLPIPQAVYESVMTYLTMAKKSHDQDQPLFSPEKNNITKEKHKSLHPNSIAYIVKRYAKMAGVHYKVSPHSARATAVSNALDNKAPHRSVQHMAGWTSPLMVARYDKRKQDLKNSAVQYVNYEIE